MSFRKVTQGKNIIVIGNQDDVKDLFQPGFRYQLGTTIYTVIKDATQDVTASMREVVTSDGNVEIMPVEVIKKDLKEADSKVLEPDQKYVVKTAEEKKENSDEKKK